MEGGGGGGGGEEEEEEEEEEASIGSRLQTTEPYAILIWFEKVEMKISLSVLFLRDLLQATLLLAITTTTAIAKRQL